MKPDQKIAEHEAETHQIHPVVYTIPNMEQAHVRKNITYKTVETDHLKFDVYYPANHQKHKSLPAVLLIHGDGPVNYLKHIKDSGQYTSWGKLIAASGLIAITANHRSTEGLTNVVGVSNDVDDLIAYVREQSEQFHIDANTLGLWTCSAGALFGLRAALYETPAFIRCLVSYYGFTELQAYYQGLYGEIEKVGDFIRPTFSEEDFSEFSARDLLLRRINDVPPMFMARAGLDYPELNAALDNFIIEALAQNTTLTVMNHPTGQHGFDILNPNARSEEIIEASLEFLQTHLLR
jgi:acetyl esterase/lipase